MKPFGNAIIHVPAAVLELSRFGLILGYDENFGVRTEETEPEGVGRNQPCDADLSGLENDDPIIGHDVIEKFVKVIPRLEYKIAPVWIIDMDVRSHEVPRVGSTLCIPASFVFG